jgi:hypothetical protein
MLFYLRAGGSCGESLFLQMAKFCQIFLMDIAAIKKINRRFLLDIKKINRRFLLEFNMQHSI